MTKKNGAKIYQTNGYQTKGLVSTMSQEALDNTSKIRAVGIKDKLLLSARESAELLGISERMFYGIHSTGRLGPMPVRLNKRFLGDRKSLMPGLEFCQKRAGFMGYYRKMMI